MNCPVLDWSKIEDGMKRVVFGQPIAASYKHVTFKVTVHSRPSSITSRILSIVRNFGMK